MSEEQSVWFWLTALTVVSMALGFSLGFGILRDFIRADSVKAGAAEWTADEDGKPEFKWKVAK